MRSTRYVMALAGMTLVGNICLAFPSSSELEDQLNVCRQEYKDLVATTNEELNKLKAKAPSNFPTIYKQKQNLLKKKADGCKDIKKQIEFVKNFEARTQSVRNAPVGEKVGPQFRCYQLGQNWSEFESCSNSLGMKPEITESLAKTIIFVTPEINRMGDRAVVAQLDDSNHIISFSFEGNEFWGTSSFDNHFLQAFVDNYDIDELVADYLSSSPKLLEFNLGPRKSRLYYKGNISGGTIEIIPDYSIVKVKRTQANSGYKF